MDNKIDNLKHILYFYTHKYSSIIRPVLSLIKFSLHSISLFPRSGINCTSILESTYPFVIDQIITTN